MKSIDFGPLDLDTGFEPLTDKPLISAKVISNTLDHEAKSGQRTRLIKVEPGYRNGPHDHPYWEELVILKGSMYEGDAAEKENKHTTHAHAIRAPGYVHGPLRTDETCFMFEVNWYASSNS